MPNLCCWPLPFHWIQVYNRQAGLSGTQRTHIFPMPAASFEIADGPNGGPGSFQAFDPPISPCASFSSLGPGCSIASSPSARGRVFVRVSTGSAEQSFKGLGKGQHMWRAACADSLHLRFVFTKKKKTCGRAERWVKVSLYLSYGVSNVFKTTTLLPEITFSAVTMNLAALSALFLTSNHSRSSVPWILNEFTGVLIHY